MDRYRSHIPGSRPYGGTEPAGYRQAILGGEGSEDSIVSYSASQNAERYVAKTQHIVAFRGILPAMDLKQNPPRKELYKDHVEGNKPLSMPWGSTRDQPVKADGFSPKARHEAIHVPDKGSPFHVERDKPISMPWGLAHDRPEKTDGFSPKARHEAIHVPNRGFPGNGIYSSPTRDQDYGKPHVMPWSSTHDHPEKVDGFSPKASHIPDKGSPTTEKVYRYYSSPPREHDYGKYNQHNYKDDDLECNNGVCVKNTKEGAIRSNYPKENSYDPNQKHKGTGYDPPAYTIPSSIQPRKDTFYEKSSTYGNKVKHAGYDYTTPNTYTVPVSTQPTKETYYETPHIDNNKKYMGNSYTTPPPIKTRIDRGREMEFSTGSGKNSPVYNSPSRKDHQEIIDSAEARKRYIKASPKAGARAYSEEYVGTIDSREAARKYNGVLISK